MSSEKHDESEVQRMLALKRHEQPPPAFFQGFSDKVIHRIQAAGPAPKLTWRERLSVEFYGMPIYICAAGVVVFGLLVLGMIGSLRVEPPEPRSASGPGEDLLGREPAHVIVPPQPRPNVNATAPTVDRSRLPVSATLAVPEPKQGK